MLFKVTPVSAHLLLSGSLTGSPFRGAAQRESRLKMSNESLESGPSTFLSTPLSRAVIKPWLDSQQACKLKLKLIELTSCLSSAAASAVCFEVRVASLDATKKGNEFPQPKFEFISLIRRKERCEGERIDIWRTNPSQWSQNAVTLARLSYVYVQGDTSHCFQPPIDMKTKVALYVLYDPYSKLQLLFCCQWKVENNEMCHPVDTFCSAVLSSVILRLRTNWYPLGAASLNIYRVTIQLVQNLPLTSKQKRNFSFEVNGRFATRVWLSPYRDRLKSKSRRPG